MKVQVTIRLKSAVLDPQGRAIANALQGLGFDGVRDARQGKVIELDLADGTPRAQVEDMCRRLLANPVIERFDIAMAADG